MKLPLFGTMRQRLLPPWMGPLRISLRSKSRVDEDRFQRSRPDWQVIFSGKINKGLAFSIEERQRLGILGLFPGSVRSMEEQIYASRINLGARDNNLTKAYYLNGLHSRHQRLYFRYVRDYITEVLPIIYTPTVGDLVTTYSLNFQFATSMFVNIYDRGHIRDILHNWVEESVRAICVTDGGRILGLGDMGANGMGISIGKIRLYTALAGVQPQILMPVCLDVGTDNKDLLNDPLYVGIRRERVKGKEYEDFVQEFVDSVVDCYGRDTLIHFEDFATPNAFKFLDRYRESHCAFNDDIQGTGCTGLAGFLNVERITGKKLEETTFLFVGAGSAAVGIIMMLVAELKRRRVPEDEVGKNIYIYEHTGLWTCDSKNVPEMMRQFLKPMDAIKELDKTVDVVKPSIMLGATGKGGIFTEAVLKNMAKHNDLPAIFALSNPTVLSECSAEQAYTHTEGKVLFCSGSPFPPVTVNGKRYEPSQANNCLVFPGIALGAICSRARYLPDEVYTLVSHELANRTSKKRLDAGALYPTIQEAADIAFHVGVVVAKYVYKKQLSFNTRTPEDITEYVKSQQYKMEYRGALAPIWEYPPEPPLPPAPKDSKP